MLWRWWCQPPLQLDSRSPRRPATGSAIADNSGEHAYASPVKDSPWRARTEARKVDTRESPASAHGGYDATAANSFSGEHRLPA
jgi:hypothetical protein